MLAPSERPLRVPDRRRVRPTHAHCVQRSSGPLDSHAERCPRLIALGEDIVILTTQKRIQTRGGDHIIPRRDRNQAATQGATVEDGLNRHDQIVLWPGCCCG
jgi:hypothetical protein